jgi:hypothetical protein
LASTLLGEECKRSSAVVVVLVVAVGFLGDTGGLGEAKGSLEPGDQGAPVVAEKVLWLLCWAAERGPAASGGTKAGEVAVKSDLLRLMLSEAPREGAGEAGVPGDDSAGAARVGAGGGNAVGGWSPSGLGDRRASSSPNSPPPWPCCCCCCC